jgi:hypothetical protein
MRSENWRLLLGLCAALNLIAVGRGYADSIGATSQSISMVLTESPDTNPETPEGYTFLLPPGVSFTQQGILILLENTSTPTNPVWSDVIWFLNDINGSGTNGIAFYSDPFLPFLAPAVANSGLPVVYLAENTDPTIYEPSGQFFTHYEIHSDVESSAQAVPSPSVLFGMPVALFGLAMTTRFRLPRRCR